MRDIDIYIIFILYLYYIYIIFILYLYYIYIIFILVRYSETQKTCNLLQCFLHLKHIESLGLPDPFPPVNDR